MAKQKALKVLISGTYQNSKKETIDFEDVVGVIPFTDDERAMMHIRKRYAGMWIKSAKDDDGNKLYPQHVHRVRTVYIDDMQETEHEFSFIGKDIKQMSFEELQDLATLKDLRFIPAKKEDMRMARMRAYEDYSKKVLKNEDVDHREEGFADKFMKMPAIIVEDAEPLQDNSGKITNDEIIQQEMDSTSTSDDPRTRFTLPELKKLADEKGISYASNIGFDAMYKKLYGE